MTAQPSFFIGYFDLEEWAAWTQANAGKQINACLLRAPGSPGQYGERIDKLVIECSQVWAGEAHYCRIPVGSLAMLNGQPWDSDAKALRERAEQAWEIVQAWLLEQGFQIRPAMISRPRDLMLVDGAASFLGHDKTDGYFRK